MQITLHNRQQAHQAIQTVWEAAKEGLQAGRRFVLKLSEETRTEAQNRVQWPILTEFSKQLEWPVNGAMCKLEPGEWKDVLTAAFFGETVRIASGLNGGLVMLGQRTSKFTKPQFSEWIEFLHATAANRGVKLPAYREIEE